MRLDPLFQRMHFSRAAYLLMEFGYQLPERPPAWFRRQERPAAVRDSLARDRRDAAGKLLDRGRFDA